MIRLACHKPVVLLGTLAVVLAGGRGALAVAHPRLLFSDVSGLQAKISSGVSQKVWELKLQPAVQGYFEDGVLSQRVRGWYAVHDEENTELLNLAFAYLMTGNATYAEAARVLLISKANLATDPLGPGYWKQHQENAAGGETDISLGAGANCVEISLAYDWLYDRLGPDEQVTVRIAIGNSAQKIYDLYTKTPDSVLWYHRRGNQGTRAMAGLAMAGLALEGEDNRAADWLHYARGQLNAIIDECFSDTGLWCEGSWGYFAYAFEGLAAAASALKQCQVEDLWAYANGKLGKVTNYCAYTLTPFRYGNAPFGQNCSPIDNHMPWGYMALANAYGSGVAQWLFDKGYIDNTRLPNSYGDAYIRHLPYIIIWYNKDVPELAPEAAGLPTATVLRAPKSPNTGLAVLRSGWGLNDIQFILNTYSSYSSKMHADAGNFILCAQGERLAWEFGEKDSADISCVSTEAHNCVLIDGKGMPLPREDGWGANGEIKEFIHTDTLDYVRADATASYSYENYNYENDNPRAKAERNVIFMRPDYFVIADDYDKGDRANHKYEWLLHTSNYGDGGDGRESGNNHDIVENGAGGFVVKGTDRASARLYVNFSEPQALDYTKKLGASDIYNPPTKPPYIMVRSAAQRRRGTFLVSLWPTAAGDPEPQITSIRQGTVVGMSVADRNDLVLFNPEGQDWAYGPVLSTDARLYASRGGARSLVQGATHFDSENAIGFTAPKPVTAVFDDGSSGQFTCPEAMTITLHLPNLGAVLVDGQQVTVQDAGTGESSIDLPAGTHTISVVLTSAPLTIRLTAQPLKAAHGEVVTYSAVVQNPGAVAATNIVVKIPVAAEMHYLDGGVLQNGFAVFDVGELAAGASTTVKLRVLVK